MNLPAVIPAANARLPQTYESARLALSKCSQIDECQDWADKAAALASYAKQAEDDELERMATRIRSRAIARAGELLKSIAPQVGGDRKSEGRPRPVDRTSAARDAGMSERQKKTALRVANIPKEEFEALVESPKPPTVTALAERGKKRRTASQKLPGKEHAPPPRHAKAPSDALVVEMQSAIRGALARWPKEHPLSVGIAALEQELRHWRSMDELRRGPSAA